MTGRETLRALDGGRRTEHEVSYDEKGKLVLPDVPAGADVAGLCAWLTRAFSLDRAHPITTGRREGLRGPEGHVVLDRAGAQSIRFEPAKLINAPAKLIETLSWMVTETDGAVPKLTGDHCRQIAYAVRLLCGASELLSAEQEAEGIIGTLMSEAVPIEGLTTYGTTGQRYEAAVALRPETDPTSGRAIGPKRYLIDQNTGELVIGVSDLQEAARRHVGSSLPRGWLDGRMETLGWSRIELDGHELPGRAGRQGRHARVNAYRGILRPVGDLDQDAVTT